MTTTTLTDGRVLHIPGTPFIRDAVSVIMAPADEDLARIAPMIRNADLMCFTSRLLRGVRKRRDVERYRDVNRARLELAKLCIDRILNEGAGLPSGAV